MAEKGGVVVGVFCAFPIVMVTDPLSFGVSCDSSAEVAEWFAVVSMLVPFATVDLAGVVFVVAAVTASAVTAAMSEAVVQDNVVVAVVCGVA